MNEIVSKFFYTDKLNKKKFNSVKKKAATLRIYRNYISEIIYKYLIENKELPDMFEIIKQETKMKIPGLINKDMEYAIKTVYTNYINKIKTKGIEKFFILKKSKNKYIKKQTAITNLTNFLLKKHIIDKNSAEIHINYVLNLEKGNSKFSAKEIEKIKTIYRHYLELIKNMDQKKLERIFKLVENRTKRIFTRYWAKKIEYNSLTFSTQSRVNQEIIGRNKNNQSCIRSFINLGAYNTKKIHIPVKTVKYHKADYVKSYSITFINEYTFRIDLTTTKENLFDFSNNDFKVGVDINIKHNLFALSNLKTFDIEKEIKESAIKIIKKADKRKETEFMKRIKQKSRNRLIYEVDKKISEIITYCISENINHIALEDLSIVGSRLRVNNKELEISYGRLATFLNLDSIKNRIRRQGHNRGVSVSFVPAEYTSQKCNKCHYVSKNNRKTQEKFICMNCGYEINADVSSGKNIKNVLIEDVLRESFLDFDSFYCEYNVKKGLSKDFIRIIYYNLFNKNT
jgi:transposase